MALSSLEVQYMAIFQVSKEAVEIVGLLHGLLINLETSTVIFGNSQGALALANNPVFRSRSKHINIQNCFTIELVSTGHLLINCILRGSILPMYP